MFMFILINILLPIPVINDWGPSSSTENIYEIKYTVPARVTIGEEVTTVKGWMDSVEKAKAEYGL